MRSLLLAFLCVAPIPASDLVVVGSGVAGLSTALEAGRNGADVVVLEMSSVFGGHAVMSEGGLALVDTKTQRDKGVHDSIEIGRADFLRWGESPNVPWVDRFVRESSPRVHDWLVEMGLHFTVLRQTAGNTVPRFHENSERGLGIARVLFQACLKVPNIRFVWNTEAVRLIRDGNKVAGVEAKNLRTGETAEFRGPVVLATGGFQSNLAFLKDHWPKALVFPERMLIGSGVNSKGSGHKMATDAGAALVQLERQWNYPWGMPDPRYEDGSRGISVRMPYAIWVNRNGVRFVDEHTSPRDATPALLKQPGATYWAIYDEPGKKSFIVAGTDWTNPERVHALLLNNPKLVRRANTLDELAAKIGVPGKALTATVERFNSLVDTGVDSDFGRFGKGRERDQSAHRRPPAKLLEPPFYAIQMYPLSRKSMGGIATDDQGRALTADGSTIPGLFAVGEASGEGGLNGVAALEGTFLAPSILQGRIIGAQFHGTGAVSTTKTTPTTNGKAIACDSCHNIKALIATPRPGYWHFERVHSRVLDKKFECLSCHSEMTPFRPAAHKIDRSLQASHCAKCHLAAD